MLLYIYMLFLTHKPCQTSIRPLNTLWSPVSSATCTPAPANACILLESQECTNHHLVLQAVLRVKHTTSMCWCCSCQQSAAQHVSAYHKSVGFSKLLLSKIVLDVKKSIMVFKKLSPCLTLFLLHLLSSLAATAGSTPPNGEMWLLSQPTS